MLYFFMVTQKAACETLSKAFLESMRTWYRSCWCLRYLSQRILKLKICSVVLLPALEPACSSAMVFSACHFNLFSMIFSMTLLGWLMRLFVRYFWHCCRLPCLGSVVTKDWVHRACHSPVCQMLLQIVVRAVITFSPLPGSVLLGCCRFQLTSLSSMIELHPPLLCEGWGWSSPVCVWGQFSTDRTLLGL